MPNTLDSRSLTLSQREMENLQDQEMRMFQLRQTLLSCLSEAPIGNKNENQSNQEMSKILNSEEILLQELKHLSKTSETRKWQNSRLFTGSYELSKKQTSMNKSDRQPSTNTPPRWTSSTHSNVALNNAENMQLSLLEWEMNKPVQEIPTETYPNREERSVGRDPTIMKPENSCVTYEENSQGSVDTECPPILLTPMMDPPQGREKESRIRRNSFTNPNCHGTLLRPMPRIVKSMRTVRKQERSLESSSVISPLLRETYINPPQLHRVSQSQRGNASFMEKPSILTSSLAISTILPLLRRMLATLEEQRSLLEAQFLCERSKQVVTGLPHGM